MDFNEIKLYLPKYLSAETQKELFENLNGFPDTIDERLYTSKFIDEEIVYQGDGLQDMLIINLPSPHIKLKPGLVLSNSCDINPENERFFDSRVMYAPIFNLRKYEETLRGKGIKSKQAIDNHLKDIRNQLATQIFYLPKKGTILEESIVFLDRVLNMPIDSIDKQNLKTIRLFSLSQYGHYLFVFKLSLHLSRIREGIDRDN
ncbi:MAG: hypothetical protein ACQERS_11515 [Bacteroidota bacterium]